ncbi:MAG: TonB-dependent receptor [Gammaproteobacteria bacterium]|nr:MAG: TonB-dependent receptor [Gammaproteobacteria bacterium]
MVSSGTEELTSTLQKALSINRDACQYGTIVEIGAGQEVARHFFQAGGASNSIAKTMSAYDMQFSDAIYGGEASGRYVSRHRLESMLEKEYGLLLERLEGKRAKNTQYFAYAATIATRNADEGGGQGWIGVRLQLYPGAPPSEIVVHIRLLDREIQPQQQAAGIIGVNLIHAAYNSFRDSDTIIEALKESLGISRIEVDLIHFSGPYFDETENRLANLYLVNSGLTRAVLFDASGQVVIPSDAFYRKDVLAIRGSFRPVTNVNVDMMQCGLQQFTELPEVEEQNVMVLAEITMNTLMSGGKVDSQDFLARVDMLNALGYTVLISDYLRFFRLRAFFRRYTQKQIGIVLGVPNVQDIFNEDYYQGLEGGILEAFGKLFPANTHLYVYPSRNQETREICTAENIELPTNMRQLYQHMLVNELILPLQGAHEEMLDIFSRDVLQQITKGHGEWESQMPAEAAEMIIENRWFNFDSA